MSPHNNSHHPQPTTHNPQPDNPQTHHTGKNKNKEELFMNSSLFYSREEFGTSQTAS
jgi:hypothetical protein